MYKQLLLLGILASCNLAADSAEYNSGQGEQSKKTGLVANVKKGANAMYGALWKKRSKKARFLMTVATANLLCGMILMQNLPCGYDRNKQIWPKNETFFSGTNSKGQFFKHEFKLSPLKKVVNLLPKVVQAQLVIPARVAALLVELKYNLPGKLLHFIQNNLVIKGDKYIDSSGKITTQRLSDFF